MSIEVVQIDKKFYYQVRVPNEFNDVYQQRNVNVARPNAYVLARDLERALIEQQKVESLSVQPLMYGAKKINGTKFSSLTQIQGVFVEAVAVKRKARPRNTYVVRVVPKLTISMDGTRKSYIVKDLSELKRKWREAIELVCEIKGINSVPPSWKRVSIDGEELRTNCTQS